MSARDSESKDPLSHVPVRPEWLASRTEAVLEPALPIVDAHHHLWDPPGGRYLFDDFLQDVASGHNITATAFVQCRTMYRASGPEAFSPVGETEFVAGAAARSDSGQYGPTRICASIVGSVDLALGDRVAPVLESHIAAAGGRFRGIRGKTSAHPDGHINEWHTHPGALRLDVVRRAIAQIASHGLVLDVLVFQTQLEDVLELCRAFPNLPVVLNHFGRPLAYGPFKARQPELFAQWVEGMKALGRQPNAFVKISGMATLFLGHEFHLKPFPPTSSELADTWRPYFETCVDAFGPDRCMFASNFPVDKAMCGYVELWNAFKKMSQGYSPAERRALFQDTASRVYRISGSR